MRRSPLVSCVSLVFLCACGSNPSGDASADAAREASATDAMGTDVTSDASTGDADHRGGAGGPVPSAGQTYRIQVGASTIIQPGVQSGYGLTANTGSSYRLVWSGQGSGGATQREFYGSVYTAGRFLQMAPGCAGSACPLEAEDFVSTPQTTTGGQRIDFDCFTTTGLDGFDFAVDSEPVYFDLYIDGVHQPTQVFFPATDNGGAIANVADFPFGLLTQ